MITQELIDFIEQQLQSGNSKKHITEMLRANGWDVAVIKSALALFALPKVQPAKPFQKFLCMLKANRVVVVSLLCVFFYAGAVVYASGGPFLPGQTLDPTSCTPSDSTCVVETGVIIGQPVVNGIAKQILYTDNSGNVASDSDFTRDSSTGFTTISSQPFLVNNASSPIFNGTGLNDLTSSGTFSGSGDLFTITIASTGSPDAFSWTDTDGHSGGSTLITGGAQPLAEGISITFAAITGHTVGDRWFVYYSDVTSGLEINGSGVGLYYTATGIPQLSYGLGLSGNGLTFSNAGSPVYTFPNADGTSGQVMTTNGSGSVTWVSPLIGSTAGNAAWLGNGAGSSGGSTDYTVFLGVDAGQGATNASDSNFFGENAGCDATDAYDSNFFGYDAGCYATNGYQSNFFGQNAGLSATNANNSAFFGYEAGDSADAASGSDFIGSEAGYNVGQLSGTGASNANFFGDQAGYEAYAANGSTFMGYQSGYEATSAHDSNFIGYQAGYSAPTSYDSNFFGNSAGYQADGAQESGFIGYQAGYEATGAYESNFFGYDAGYGATNALGSEYIGDSAGGCETFGNNACDTNAGGSDFIGDDAGQGATNANSSVFLGYSAGRDDLGTSGDFFNSDFIGFQTGLGATYATDSNFIGNDTGSGAVNANNSIFIGDHAGVNDTVENAQIMTLSSVTGTFAIGDTLSNGGGGTATVVVGGTTSIGVTNVSGSFSGTVTGTPSGAHGTYVSLPPLSGTSILIGENTLTGGYSNSIALGSWATNTAANQFMIGSIQFPISSTIINGTGGITCSIDSSSAHSAQGIACSSDERLKTNIVDLPTDTLDTLDKVRTVTFNWDSNPTGPQNIGFLAQDIQQEFPQVVETGPGGYLEVNYTAITPVIVEAVRELDLKVTNIQNFATSTDTTFLDNMIAWLGNSANGITSFFATTITGQTVNTQQLCVGTTCVDQAQLQTLLTLDGMQSSGSVTTGGGTTSSGGTTTSGTTSTTSDATGGTTNGGSGTSGTTATTTTGGSGTTSSDDSSGTGGSASSTSSTTGGTDATTEGGSGTTSDTSSGSGDTTGVSTGTTTSGTSSDDSTTGTTTGTSNSGSTGGSVTGGTTSGSD